MTAMRAFSAVTVLLFAAAGALEAAASCGNPVQSGVLQGTFREFTLDDQCESADAMAYSLTTDLMDAAPLFAVRTNTTAGCTWSIATIVNDRISVITRVNDDMWGVTPAAAADHSYWFVGNERYVRATADGYSYVDPIDKSYVPVSVGSMADGRLYAIETLQSKAQEKRLRLVSLADKRSVAIPLAGWTEKLNRAANGHLYFRLFEKWHCHIFEVLDSGAPIERAPCMWENGNGIAVSPDGGIWQPRLLGIGESSVDGKPSRSVGPIEPFPCDITNTAALEPGLIRTDKVGTVWFVYGKLWRFDTVGKLSSIVLPTTAWPSGMVITSDGALWIVESDSYGHGALYRFIPSPR